MSKVTKLQSDISFKSGTKIQCDKGNVYQVYSCVNLDWMYGEEKPSHLKKKYLVFMKFLGNFSPIKKELVSEEMTLQQ